MRGRDSTGITRHFFRLPVASSRGCNVVACYVARGPPSPVANSPAAVWQQGLRVTAANCHAGTWLQAGGGDRNPYFSHMYVAFGRLCVPLLPQAIFEEDDRVLFISLHQAGNYPIASGE